MYMSARAIVHMPLEMLLSYAEKPTILLELCCQDPISFESQTNSIKTLGHDQPQSSRQRKHVKLAVGYINFVKIRLSQHTLFFPSLEYRLSQITRRRRKRRSFCISLNSLHKQVK